MLNSFSLSLDYNIFIGLLYNVQDEAGGFKKRMARLECLVGNSSSGELACPPRSQARHLMQRQVFQVEAQANFLCSVYCARCCADGTFYIII